MTLHPWELDAIRRDIEGTFIELADIYRRTGNPDDYGGTGDYVKVLDAVKCDMHPVDYFRPKQVGLTADATIDIVYQSIGFPVGTAVREGDLVDVYTQGIKITVMQVQRGETDDAFIHAYGSVFDEGGWFELSFHEGGHHS
jgi:hypothetical protein